MDIVSHVVYKMYKCTSVHASTHNVTVIFYETLQLDVCFGLILSLTQYYKTQTCRKYTVTFKNKSIYYICPIYDTDVTWKYLSHLFTEHSIFLWKDPAMHNLIFPRFGIYECHEMGHSSERRKQQLLSCQSLFVWVYYETCNLLGDIYGEIRGKKPQEIRE